LFLFSLLLFIFHLGHSLGSWWRGGGVGGVGRAVVKFGLDPSSSSIPEVPAQSQLYEGPSPGWGGCQALVYPTMCSRPASAHEAAQCVSMTVALHLRFTDPQEVCCNLQDIGGPWT
jgi:hypothetical protein